MNRTYIASVTAKTIALNNKANETSIVVQVPIGNPFLSCALSGHLPRPILAPLYKKMSQLVYVLAK